MFATSPKFVDLRTDMTHAGSPASRNLVSPLSAALYVENRELIRKAVRILCEALDQSSIHSFGHVDKPRIPNDFVFGLEQLSEAFNIGGETEKVEGTQLSFKDFYNASQHKIGTDQELRELYVFASVLQDGYILCEYLNQLRSKRVTNPVRPNCHDLSFAHTLDNDTDNLQQFLSYCVVLGIPKEDLFEPSDLTMQCNERLAYVAATIVAVSKRRKLRTRRSVETGSSPANFVPAIWQGSLSQQAKRFRLIEPPRTSRSLDDNKAALSVNTAPPFPAQPRPLQDSMTLFSTILRDKNMYRRLLELKDRSAQMSLDVLQKIINSGMLPKEHRATFVSALLRLSLKSSLYPSCLILKDVEREPFPRASGTFGDVYKGSFRGSSVCIKMVRVYKKSQIDHALRAFSREAVLWSQTKHPNVLPFYGIYQLDDVYRRVCLISPWMENGNVREYLDGNPQADRLSLIRDVLRGLRYLHDKNIIHGDLKGPNILVSPSGRACLGDFGLSSVSDPNVLQWTSLESSGHAGGTVRWKAPELIDPDADNKPTKESDMYSLGCVCYEIFTGAVPFHEVPHDYGVILCIIQGKTPSKPPDNSDSFIRWGLTETIWGLIEECWTMSARKRPTARNVAQRLPRSLMPFRKKPKEVEISGETTSHSTVVVGREEVDIPRELIDTLTKICTAS